MYNNNYCSNCGKYGHSYKKCVEPITSLGVIALKINIDEINKYLLEQNIKPIKKNFLNNKIDVNILRMNIININNFKLYKELKKNIYFLLISRKNSLGLLEFMRGRYDIYDINSIIYLYKQFYKEEVELIKVKSFDFLWKYVWQIQNIEADTEYLNSKKKFDNIKDRGILKNIFDTIEIDNINHEWGFPKGRRSNTEKNLESAIREFKEETSLEDNNFEIINNIQPVTENLIGTNNINYKHIYYFALCNFNQKVLINKNNKLQNKEVGNIDWFKYDEVKNLLRNYHVNKKIIINNIFIHICNLIQSNN